MLFNLNPICISVLGLALLIKAEDLHAKSNGLFGRRCIEETVLEEFPLQHNLIKQISNQKVLGNLVNELRNEDLSFLDKIKGYPASLKFERVIFKEHLAYQILPVESFGRTKSDSLKSSVPSEIKIAEVLKILFREDPEATVLIAPHILQSSVEGLYQPGLSFTSAHGEETKNGLVLSTPDRDIWMHELGHWATLWRYRLLNRGSVTRTMILLPKRSLVAKRWGSLFARYEAQNIGFGDHQVDVSRADSFQVDEIIQHWRDILFVYKEGDLEGVGAKAQIVKQLAQVGRLVMHREIEVATQMEKTNFEVPMYYFEALDFFGEFEKASREVMSILRNPKRSYFEIERVLAKGSAIFQKYGLKPANQIILEKFFPNDQTVQSSAFGLIRNKK